MQPSSSASAKPISLDDLVALNDELASLIRAGIPLQLGLRGLAGNVSRRLSSVSTRLAERIERGEALDEALKSEAGALPPVYRCLVEAGSQAGRLPEALDALSQYAVLVRDVRRRTLLALIYPLLVMLLAYYLFWMTVRFAAVGVVRTVLEPGEAASGWLLSLQSAADVMDMLGHIPPLVVVVLFVWWMVAGKMVGRAGGMASAALRWIPGIGGMLRKFELAQFSQLAAMLLEHQVPGPRALELAAEATGNRGIRRDVALLNDAQRRGESLAQSVAGARTFPKFMRWMLGVGDRHGALAPTLRQLSQSYLLRAVRQAERFSFWLPIVLTLTIAGAAVVVYSLAVFVPFTNLMNSLSLE